MFPIKKHLVNTKYSWTTSPQCKISCAKLHSTSKTPYTWRAEKQYYEKGISQFMLSCQNSCTATKHKPTTPSTKEPISVQQQPTVRITTDKDDDDDKWSWTNNNWLWITLWFYYFHLPRHTCSLYWEHMVTWWHVDLNLFQRYVESYKQSRNVCLLQPRYSFILHMHLCVGMGSSAMLLGSSIINIWMPKRMKADTRSKYSKTLQTLWILEN